ncbi:DUF4132 domain-containing protein [Microbacterium sp. gxy059]|uniref:DUF4132 domain-containing protein n=1 Tax=Microbacterium sp. gxy059 TaxID=2957199 RepID=UPI003D95279A
MTVSTGHEITLRDGAIVARSAAGRELKSVPVAVRKTEEHAQLDALRGFLARHDEEAGATVQGWLLGSEPVSRLLLAEVWTDPVWRSWLADLVVTEADVAAPRTGFLRAADADGLGVVDLDGDSVRLAADAVLLPHPALIDDLDELRASAADLGIEQRFDQLFRDVHARPEDPPAGVDRVDDCAGGEFAELRHATARAVAAGYRIRGGFAVVRVAEGGRTVTAAYWVGAEHPEAPTITGHLQWTADGARLPLGDVGPVAWSEGMRMAAHIFAGRTIEQEEER